MAEQSLPGRSIAAVESRQLAKGVAAELAVSVLRQPSPSTVVIARITPILYRQRKA